MPKIKGFTTKKADWQKDVMKAIEKDEKAVFKMNMEVDKEFSVQKNPLGDIIKTPKLKGKSGRSFKITTSRKPVTNKKLYA